MRKTYLLVLGFTCLLALAGAVRRPAYHLPPEDWRIRHGQRLRLPDKNPPGPAFFDLGECLLCHRPRKSCDLCHRKLGVGLVGGLQGKGGS